MLKYLQMPDVLDLVPNDPEGIYIDEARVARLKGVCRNRVDTVYDTSLPLGVSLKSSFMKSFILGRSNSNLRPAWLTKRRPQCQKKRRRRERRRKRRK